MGNLYGKFIKGCSISKWKWVGSIRSFCLLSNINLLFRKGSWRIIKSTYKNQRHSFYYIILFSRNSNGYLNFNRFFLWRVNRIICNSRSRKKLFDSTTLYFVNVWWSKRSRKHSCTLYIIFILETKFIITEWG